MTIKNVLNWASQKIAPFETEILLAYVLRVDKVWLWKNPDYLVSKRGKRKFQKLINRRLAGEPIAYIINHQEFYGLDFYVDRRVLIPRPETEILVSEIINHIKNSSPKFGFQILIADIGTGSSCIAVAIATELKIKNSKLKIYGIDVSKDALEVAEINAERHNIESEIEFLHGDLLKPLPEKVDIIVANLPYICLTNPKRSSGDCWIQNQEPKIALNGGKDGLYFIKKLLQQATNYLKPNGRIFLEISPEQKSRLKIIINRYFPDARHRFKKDLSDRERVLEIISSEARNKVL